MNILVTGAKGFLGKNLCHTLKQTHTVWECHRKTPPEELETYCCRADLVFHLAGVNRAETEAEFWKGNVGFTETLLQVLTRQGNRCPVVFASSIHAGENTPYGQSKQAAEELVLSHGDNTAVYRLPNLFGKWCRPNYNSVVATFCHNLANNLPIRVDDAQAELQLAYIDDVVAELCTATKGKTGVQTISVIHRISVGDLAQQLQQFRRSLEILTLPAMDTFTKQLYATFLSFLPREMVCLQLTTHADTRGSFTELLRPDQCGQLSVNIIRPGQTKGQHWHHSKWELFWVVSGEGLIRQRQVDREEILDFPVTGNRMEAVRILPGYVHSIQNTSLTEDLVTVIWASEWFDPEKPDTVYEEV